MEIAVLVEPFGTGFRATTQSPCPLTADGPTEDAAVEALGSLLGDRLRAGGKLRTLSVPDLNGLAAAGAALAANPLFDRYLESIEEYRRVHNAVPDDE